jgi:hypothetical protein
MANGAMDRRYALASEQLRRKEQMQAEKEKEALQRRFAATGSLSSGASIKAEQMASQESAKRFGEAQGELEMARLGEQAQQEEIEKQRQFQRGEREAGQMFASGEREAGQMFASGEREAGQMFASEQAELQRKFTSGERLSAQEFAKLQAGEQMKFAREQNRMNRRLQEQGIDLQKKEFEINKLVSLFNMGGGAATSAKNALASILGLPNEFYATANYSMPDQPPSGFQGTVN